MIFHIHFQRIYGNLFGHPTLLWHGRGDGEVKNELSFYEYRIRAYVYDGGRIPPSLVARKNG